MEFLKATAKRRSLLSEAVYVLLNVGLVALVLGSVVATSSPVLAIVLVVLSKWRVFAVRLRYWFVNIQANLVDTIVGISFAVSMWLSGAIEIQIGLAVLFIVWLLVVKPRSRILYIHIQSATALFMGVNTLLAVAYGWWASVTVFAMWLIGYSAARHILSHNEEPHVSFYSLAWGFVVAELGWLFHHWTIAYSIGLLGSLAIAQGAVIVLLFGLAANRLYVSYRKHGQFVQAEVVPPLVFSLAVTAMLLIFFNDTPSTLV